ncbi:hypothetical protein D6789_02760 [Candidatus Woesearchaeota archaeon]|nr:MAG: hypothetical protein D6789_02760 [Candidatus Woesearchaeota archaeon]
MQTSKLFLFVLLAVVLVGSVSAQSGHVTLLTVAESEGGERGGTADLYLEIQPGTGQIFLDTYPLAKLDTQSSTRYATRIACEYANADCDQYDFFFTIRANSRLVGGPSAGAAIAVLTAALLTGTPIDASVAITGTIDSGGLIGPVAGVKEKALAAAEQGLSLVLISAFSYPTEVNESYLELVNKTNATVNLSRVYVPVNLSSLGIPIRTVTTLDEALAYFTGREPTQRPVTIEEDAAYRSIMQRIARELCARRTELANEDDDPLGLKEQREEAEREEDWYSLASYCFREAIAYREQQFAQLSPAQLASHRDALREAVRQFQQQMLQRTPRTMAQLETSMIVAERLDETWERLEGNLSAENLAFAHERLNSAQVWFAFWSMRSPRITLDEQHLRRACNAKLAEAQERISYVNLYLPDEYLARAKEELAKARAAADNGAPTTCIHHAAKARAQANVLSTTLATPEEQFPLMLDTKLASVARVIAQQEQFPILGYSYYRYAQSLGEHDRYSALTFAEYALELSDLAIYFPKHQRVRIPTQLIGPLLLFAGGILTGLIVALAILRPRRRRATKQTRRRENKRRESRKRESRGRGRKGRG